LSNSFTVALAALVVAAIVAGIVVTIVRGRIEESDWTASLDLPPEAGRDAAARIEIVQRLALVGEPWCLELLRQAQRRERNEAVLRAIATALKVSC
jgi:hypothetical protein